MIEVGQVPEENHVREASHSAKENHILEAS